jgi:hypothetical protein
MGSKHKLFNKNIAKSLEIKSLAVYYCKSAEFLRDNFTLRMKVINGVEARGCDTPGRFATTGRSVIFAEPVS